MNRDLLFKIVRFLFVIIIAILSVFALIYLSKLTAPFIIGFFIALIINPLVDFLQDKTKMSRGLSVFSSIIIILGVISTAITLLINEIISGFAYLSKIVPERFNQFTIYIENFHSTTIIPIYNNLLIMFEDLDQDQRSTVLESIQVLGTNLTNAFSSVTQSTANGLYTMILKLPNMATLLVISLLATFFISKDWYRLVKKVHQLVPEKVHDKIDQIHLSLQRALLGFLKAELKLTFLSACIVLVGLLILRVEHALTIALIIWLVDFLPYIGAILVFLPWIIYSFTTGDITLGIGLSILYGLVVAQRQFIKPKILSSSIGISPLATIFAMFVGFKLIGVLGIILGPLTYIFIKTLHETGIFKAIWRFIVIPSRKEEIIATKEEIIKTKKTIK